MMFLLVKRLHSWAKSLVADFKRDRGPIYIHRMIELDRKALRLRPPGHPVRSVTLTWLAIHLGNRCKSTWSDEGS